MAACPASTAGRLLHRASVARWHDATLESWSVEWGPQRGDGLLMQLMRPAGKAHQPVILSGDACWAHLNADVILAACKAGVALAWFNRTEVAADPPPSDPGGAAAPAATGSDPSASAPTPAPAIGATSGMGALAAWAWAMQRAVDVLVGEIGCPPGTLAVTGHSRGGKAALLAGALDARIALTAANNSGTLGAASSSVAGDGSESIADLVTTFPHWVAPAFRERALRARSRPMISMCCWPPWRHVACSSRRRWATPGPTPTARAIASRGRAWSTHPWARHQRCAPSGARAGTPRRRPTGRP